MLFVVEFMRFGFFVDRKEIDLSLNMIVDLLRYDYVGCVCFCCLRIL